MLRIAGWVVIGTLIAAAAYELALALGAGSIGPEPGEGVVGSGVVEPVAVVAMLAAAVIAPFSRARPWPAALLAPAAAAYLVAFFFTYDPYFAPTLRRYSDGGAVAGRWIAIFAVLALAVGVLTRLQPRLGRVTTSVVVLLLLVTSVLAGDGH
jgi:hypothetical protein